MALSEKQQELMAWSKKRGSKRAVSTGCVRSGKSYATTITFGLDTQTLRHPYLHLVLGNKLSTLKTEILPALEQVAKLVGEKLQWKDNEGKATIGDQTYLFIAGADNRSPQRLQGKTVHSILIDEATIVPEDFFVMANSRMSFKGSKMYVTCNPSKPTHWLKVNWIDKGKFDLVLHFNFEDNPALHPDVIEDLRNTFAGQGAFEKRMIHGLWFAGEGLIFSEFKHEDAWNESDIIRTDIGVDYGAASTTAFVALATGKDGRGMIMDAVRVKGGADMENQTDRQLAEHLCKLVAATGASSVVLPPEAVSFRNELMTTPNRTFVVRTAKNNRGSVIAGIRHTQNMLATGRVVINNNKSRVEPLLKEMDGYMWDTDSKIVDKPIKENDHACDAMR